MARKVQDTIDPAHLDRAGAIKLLMAQLEAGQRLLRSRPLTDGDHARWGLNVKRHLERAFGRGSPTVMSVTEAGTRLVCPVDADQNWWEAYRCERLASQLGELAGALRLLGAEPKLVLPLAVPSKTRKADPAGGTPRAAAPTAGEPAAAAEGPVGDARAASDPAPPLTATREPTAADMFAGWITEGGGAQCPEPPPKGTAASSRVDHFTGVACLNGHVITAAAEAYSTRAATTRCKDCGAATIRICRECGVGIRGGRYTNRLDDRAEPEWAVPSYCHSCGTAFPWTRLKREAIEATIAELQELDATEREGLLAVVSDMVLETPKTAVAVMRWQRAFSKLPGPTRSLVSEVLRQAAVPLVAQHLGLAT